MNKEYFNAIKLADYMFFYVPIERYERDRYIFESDKYYFNVGHICGICGEVVEIWGSRGGVKNHLVEEHPEWIDIYIIFGGYKKIDLQKLKNKKLRKLDITIPDKKKIYLKPWKDPESLFCSTKFLEILLNKEISKGDECKDNKK